VRNHNVNGGFQFRKRNIIDKPGGGGGGGGWGGGVGGGWWGGGFAR